MAYAHIASTLQPQGGSFGGFTTTAIDTTGADLVVVLVLHYGATTPTLTDSKGNTWTPTPGTPWTGGGGSYAEMYYCRGGTVGTGHTFTITGSGNYPAVGVVAVSGSHATPFDKENTGTSSGTTTVTGSTGTQDGNDLNIAGLHLSSGTAAPNTIDGTGFTVLPGGTGSWYAIAYKIKSADASAESRTWTHGSGSGIGTIVCFKAGVTGPTYTLTADVGAIAYTANAVALQAARKLTAAQATYALTGNQAGLRASRKLTAATTAFPLTAQAAALQASRHLTAGVGTFPFTAYPADLITGGGITYTLSADTVAFAYAGQDISLTAARALTAATANVPYAGRAAALLYTPVTGPVVTTIAEYLAQARAAHAEVLKFRNQDRQVAASAVYRDAYTFRLQANVRDPSHTDPAWADELVPDSVIQEFYGTNIGPPVTPGAPGTPGGGFYGVDGVATTTALQNSTNLHAQALLARQIPDTARFLDLLQQAYDARLEALTLDPYQSCGIWQNSDHDALMAFYVEQLV